MRRIVLDTNVLVSGLLSGLAPPGRIIDLVVDGKLSLLVDARILAEYREVVSRPPFGFDPVAVAIVLDAMEATAEHVVAWPTAVELPDVDDLPFLEVALAGRADALVTGNSRHFTPVSGSHAVMILSPRDLIDRLRQ